MTSIIRMDRNGGPEVLRLADHDLPAPGPGEVQIAQTDIGVNFVDVYYRSGLYPASAFPAELGVEAAGTVTAVGDGAGDFVPGDRVAYAGGTPGAYASARNLPAERLLKLPEGVSTRLAAASLLRGLTAHMLLRRVFSAKPGQTLLIHAVAGGLGLILMQWAKRLGLTVIGTAGSPEKAAMAKSFGLDHAILYRETDFVDAVREATHGTGVDFAVDGIGGDTLARTLRTLRPFGVVASVGQVAGTVPPIDINALRGIALARPSVLAFVTDLSAYRTAAEDWFAVLGEGLHVAIGGEHSLSDAASAHAALEAGKTTGSLLLHP